MLEKMLPGYYAERIANVEKSEMIEVVQYQTIPKTLSDKNIVEAEKNLAELEIKDILAKKYSDIALRIQEKSLSINETRLTHREKSTDNSQKFKHRMLKHQKHEMLANMDDYSLQAQTKAYCDGFEMVAKNIVL